MEVALLVGREQSFPDAFIDYVNNSKLGFRAEMLKVGAFRTDELCKYRIIIDRISHEIPFFRSF